MSISALIPIAGDVPHDHLVAGLDLLAAEFGVDSGRCGTCVRLATANESSQGPSWVSSVGSLQQLVVLGRELAQGEEAAGDGVAGGVVAADDQQQHVAEKLSWRAIFFVDSPWASTEIRSVPGVVLAARSFQAASKYSKHFQSSAKACSGVS